MVTRADLDSNLLALVSTVADPRAGVFGPASATWRIDRESALFLGAGRALLLQLAHPWVAQAIHDHSTTLADPIGRFHRTFDIMFTLVFGDVHQALAAARRLHRRHATIQGRLSAPAGSHAAGEAYRANEASALMWVHATLLDTALVAHDLVLPPLEPSARNAYYGESRRLAALFGIPDDVVPVDWNGFVRYRDDFLRDGLVVSEAARRIADALLVEGARRALRPPGWYRALTASLLPDPLRTAFSLDLDARQERSLARAVQRLRFIYPRLPARVRFVGPYHEALERIDGRPSPGLSTRLSNRAWIGRERL